MPAQKQVSPNKTLRLARGELLLREGGPSSEIYFLEQGSLVVAKGDIVIGRIPPPAFAGELGPILRRPRSTSIVAAADSEVHVFDGEKLLDSLTLEGKQGFHFIQTLIIRFEMTREKIADYQKSILKEHARLLSGMLVDRKFVKDQMPFEKLKQMRMEQEEALSRVLTHKDDLEDHNLLHRIARREGLEEKFRTKVAVRFRAFSPFDLSQHRTPKPNSFLNFMDAARRIGEEIVVLTRYLTDFQSLDVDRLESEIPMIEDVFPAEARSEMIGRVMDDKLADGDIADTNHLRTEFLKAMRKLPDANASAPVSLLPIAKKFGVEFEYKRLLRHRWRTLLGTEDHQDAA